MGSGWGREKLKPAADPAVGQRTPVHAIAAAGRDQPAGNTHTQRDRCTAIQQRNIQRATAGHCLAHRVQLMQQRQPAPAPCLLMPLSF